MLSALCRKLEIAETEHVVAEVKISDYYIRTIVGEIKIRLRHNVGKYVLISIRLI